jgi:hypothetical protein
VRAEGVFGTLTLGGSQVPVLRNAVVTEVEKPSMPWLF